MDKPKAFASAISADLDWRAAAKSAAAEVAKALGGPADLGLVFASARYEGLEPEALLEVLGGALSCKTWLGCNASGVIAGRKEIEEEPGVSVMGLRLPGVRVLPFHLSAAEARSLKGAPQLLEALDIYPTDRPKFLVFPDPMSCDIERLLGLFDDGFPGLPVVGGLASGPALGLPSWLVVGDEAHREGLAGVALCGAVELEIAVAQGCRPIGEPLTITKADGHVLYELGGKPPLEVLRGLLDSLDPKDRELAKHSLLAGLVMKENRPSFKRGDFLIRNLMGSDPRTGALMVGASLRAGQTLQFQLRDKTTSASDLRDLLEGLKLPEGEPCAAMLFSCCGRGQGLYGEADHDSRLVQSLQGPLPLVGFFASGELGPVAGKNHVHGYTSSVALIH